MKVLDDSGLFKDFAETFEGMRYHSMVVTRDTVPEALNITAETNDKDRLVMAFEKPDERLYSVQFHPESIGTPDGINILKNFLSL